MFDIGGPEILLIVLAVIVLFGPKKIPEVAQMIGKGMQKVRSAQAQFKDQIDEIQKEIKTVSEPDISAVNSPAIREINANELNENHLNENAISIDESKFIKERVTSIDANQDSETIPNSRLQGFEPHNPHNIHDEIYNLDKPEKDDEKPENHLNGSSHGFNG